jgi:hemerythrin
MSTLLIWRDAWSLGIDELDTDHREMVRLLNHLFDTEPAPDDDPPPRGTDANPHATRESLRNRLEAVTAHLRAHFEREEAFLAAIDYPGLEEHRREHALQMAEFVDLQRCVAAGAARCLNEEAADSVKRWFFNHVIAEDKRFAEFYFRALLG